MAQGQEGDFEGLVQVEGSWSGCWFVPGGVLVQGCGEGGELLVGERRLCAGDATLFSGGVENICDDLTLIFAVGEAISCQTILASTHDATRLNDIHLR